MNEILLYAGGGLLVLHGLLHAALLKVGLDLMGPDRNARKAMAAHWIGFGLHEAMIGVMVLLVILTGGPEAGLTALLIGAATVQCAVMAVLHFLVFRKSEGMPEKIMFSFYLVFGGVLAAGLIM